MVSRLVLGCGVVGQELLERLDSGSVRVLSADPERVERLREAGVDASTADPTDPVVIGDHGADADLIAVFGDDATTNRAATIAAADTLPEAVLVAYTGRDPTADERAAMTGRADHVLDAAQAVTDRVLSVVGGEAGLRTRRLKRALASIEGSLAIVAHDNPDPDAIASGVALARLADAVDVDATVYYYGDISHQENRAFVNLLDLPLSRLENDEMPAEAALALVDHSRPGVNDQLPTDADVDIVIDHHPPRGSVAADFADIRTDVGATSTILVDHFERLAIGFSEAIATALLYGIRVDTREFTREVSAADYEAAAQLLPATDSTALERVESPSLTADTLETIARAVTNREVRGTVLTTCVGAITDRDALSQAADRLLDIGGIRTTLVCGYMDETVYISARARGTDLDLGATLRAAFGQIGSAGGHADMAGAQVSLGLLGEVDTEESLQEIVQDVVASRFHEAIEQRPTDILGHYGRLDAAGVADDAAE
jgi:nanoRNase/pAp phosphatase (c-di-AMP/oligoRNAs hydrolase)